MNLIVSIYFIIVNFISFFLYYIDKKKACKHKYRIPEKVLLSISLFGGCFSGLAAMYIFHHKTKHLKFIIINYLSIIMWVIIILKSI